MSSAWRKKARALAGVNCCAPWDASAFVDAGPGAALPLSVMPNAGGFQRIGNRFMTSVNPEFAGKLARSFLDRGVRLIGGCCEMHPPHIREMHNYLRSRQSGAMAADIRAADAHRRPPATRRRNKTVRSRANSRMANSSSASKCCHRAVRTNGSWPARSNFSGNWPTAASADAIDITDGSRGIPLMPPGDFIHLARARLGWTDRPAGVDSAFYRPRFEFDGHPEPAHRLPRQPHPQRVVHHRRPAENVADLSRVPRRCLTSIRSR